MLTIKQIWDKSSESKRRELLKVLGYRGEWAKLSWNELGKRGGGMVKRDFFRLNKLRMKIKWQ